jgi:hypothetical protein
MEHTFLLLLLALVLGAQSAQRLSDVHKIFVGSLGGGDGANVIREKIIARLVQSGKVTIVNVPAEADAFLTGARQATAREHYGAIATTTIASASGGTRYDATAAIELTGKGGEVLWAGEGTSGFLYRSATSSAASAAAKSLVKAIEKARRQK